jgi:hypothetical protein
MIVVSDVFSIANFWVGYHSPIFVMMISVTWPFVLVGLECGLTIKFADDGVSQITLNGHQRLAWTEVVQVVRTRGAFWVAGKGVKLFLWPQ